MNSEKTADLSKGKTFVFGSQAQKKTRKVLGLFFNFQAAGR